MWWGGGGACSLSSTLLLRQICEGFHSISRKIYEKPNSIEELAELRDWMKGIPEKLVGLEVRGRTEPGGHGAAVWVLGANRGRRSGARGLGEVDAQRTGGEEGYKAGCRWGLRAMLFRKSGGQKVSVRGWRWRCGGHGSCSPEPNASLAPHAFFSTPGLPCLEESSLSLAPNHLGSSVPVNASSGHSGSSHICLCRNGL